LIAHELFSLKATENGHQIIFESLLSKGADKNVKNNYEDSPLHYGE
jgi:hypothetical protein